MNRYFVWSVPVVATGLVLSGCSSGKASEDTASSASASETSTSAAAADPNPLADTAATEYKAYVVGQIDELQRVVKVLTDAVRANNLKAAQDAFAPSRMPWERIEPIAELVEDTDAKTDSRVDDFAGVDDPKFTGWHRLEYLLFDVDPPARPTQAGGAVPRDLVDEARVVLGSWPKD